MTSSQNYSDSMTFFIKVKTFLNYASIFPLNKDIFFKGIGALNSMHHFKRYKIIWRSSKFSSIIRLKSFL